MLPLILSFLGSSAAGAGLLGTGLLASPLIAGAIGSGLGTAIETGDLGKGLQAGLLGGLGGAAMGSLMGGASGAAMGAAQGAPAAAAQGATNMAANTAAGGQTMFQKLLPGGSGMGTIPPAPGITGATFGERLGQIGSGAGQTPFMDVAKYGMQKGALTGAGMGAALAAPMFAPQLYTPDMQGPEKRDFPQADPAVRKRYSPPADYKPGYSGEHLYFDPYPTRSRYAAGGMVRMAAGGIADMPQGDGVFPGAAPQGAPPRMNEKELVTMAIKAIRNELPEQEAAMVLAQFVQTYGEDALRKVVSDVQEGRVPAGDMEGKIAGPGDGMDDLVPATMDDGSSDVLLSDGEFIVPADVVSGLGNGSTDAGAAELENMMSRVRQERTGMTQQPKQVAAGGLLPA